MLISWKEKIDVDYIKTVVSKKININKCYPKKDKLWNAFNHFEYKDTKVVFVFSGALPIVINKKTTLNLRDLLYQYECDIRIDEIFDYSLNMWRKQGILLINEIFTIPKNNSNHIYIWKPFIINLIETINKDLDNISWVFFDNKYETLITNPSHRTLSDFRTNPFEWINQKHNIKFL